MMDVSLYRDGKFTEGFAHARRRADHSGPHQGPKTAGCPANRWRVLLADPRTGDKILQKADDGRRRKAIQEIPATLSVRMERLSWQHAGQERTASK